MNRKNVAQQKKEELQKALNAMLDSKIELDDEFFLALDNDTKISSGRKHTNRAQRIKDTFKHKNARVAMASYADDFISTKTGKVKNTGYRSYEKGDKAYSRQHNYLLSEESAWHDLDAMWDENEYSAWSKCIRMYEEDDACAYSTDEYKQMVLDSSRNTMIPVSKICPKIDSIARILGLLEYRKNLEKQINSLYSEIDNIWRDIQNEVATSHIEMKLF